MDCVGELWLLFQGLWSFVTTGQIDDVISFDHEPRSFETVTHVDNPRLNNVPDEDYLPFRINYPSQFF